MTDRVGQKIENCCLMRLKTARFVWIAISDQASASIQSTIRNSAQVRMRRR